MTVTSIERAHPAIATSGTKSKRGSRITDQHSTAGRAPSRVRITRTVPPGRSVAVRGYPRRWL